ncbi:hypothetical protein [Aureimonas sp. SK2]|uniref:hypothetical protein n=1 Tax=Aureimonas sp. SK2 TaxID=3015992 RepID=UPI00244473C8|nr:hypothetical protein [Aureimonas sp. SK2]
MNAKAPPVPAENRSTKGTGESAVADISQASAAGVPGNLNEQDRQGNIKQNTTHQGYQQDR